MRRAAVALAAVGLALGWPGHVLELAGLIGAAGVLLTAAGWRQQAQRDRAIVTAAREYAAADAAYHEATTGWTEHGEAREWRLRNDARLALLAAVAASPTTERTPS